MRRKNYADFKGRKSISQKIKKNFPPSEDISVTETCAEIKLQSLLNHTISRILATQNSCILSLPHENVKEMLLLCKWGCDGTSGQSTFKQKFSNDDGTLTDSSIFFTSLVPLQLHAILNETNEKIVIWQNLRPSSPLYCRPIKIQFLHETAESTGSEVDYIKEQEKDLLPYQYVIDGKNIPITYKLSLTMVDGKVCNSLTDPTSSRSCYICSATSK